MTFFDFENKRLKSLSTRMELSFRQERLYARYKDPKILRENLSYNVAMILATLMTKMTIDVSTIELLEEEIEAYNRINHTSIKISDYLERSWIRLINGEIRIPSIVSHHIWQKFDYYNEQSPNEENDQWHSLYCLHQFSKKHLRKKPTISLSHLEALIHQYPNLSGNFLLSEAVLEHSDGNLLEWKNNDYSKQLRNEISASLWLLLFPDKESLTLDNFRRYVRLLERFNIYPDDLKPYQTSNQLKNMNKLIYDLLTDEQDLVYSALETQKVFLDSPSNSFTTINSEIPSFDFAAEDSFSLIKRIKYLERRHHDISDYQETRSIYGLLIRMLIENDSDNNEPFKLFRNLLADPSRPYIVIHGYEVLKKHANAIPFLLLEEKLAPIALDLIDHLEANTQILTEYFDKGETATEVAKIKKSYWLETYNYLLDKVCYTHEYDTYGETLIQVLSNLASKTFQFNSHNHQNSSIRHNSLYDCYEEALRILTNKRIDTRNHYADTGIRPLLATRLLKEMAKSVMLLLKDHSTYESPNFNLARIDLSIEILKIAGKIILEEEVKGSALNQTKTIETEIVKSIHDSLWVYFIEDTIDILTPQEIIRQQRARRRSISDFGAEIVDWTFLFLHFIQSSLADELNEGFKSTLLFENTREGKYSDTNNFLSNKLRLYFKILLLAHKGLSENTHHYQYSLFDTERAVSYLETSILEYALTYKNEDLENNRIDIFDETFFSFNQDIYRKQLVALLYDRVNHFTHTNKTEFIESFFQGSTDLGRMLTALNKLETKEAKDVIVNLVNEISIENFIDNAITISQLENALIEAINSESHFQIADPLLERIEKHFERVNLDNDNTRSFLFRIRLLFAFKNKNLEALKEVKIPHQEYAYNDKGAANRRKEYYIALHHIYNDRNFTEAIKSLESLLTLEPQNIDFALHLYRARLLKAYKS